MQVFLLVGTLILGLAPQPVLLPGGSNAPGGNGVGGSMIYSGPQGSSFIHHNSSFANTQLPFLATLNLPDLSRLTNDPIKHQPSWPVIPTKLPSDPSGLERILLLMS